MKRAVVVGAGVLGTMHAVMAQRRGYAVTQIDRHTEARDASVRNFGMVWISGRAVGDELALALRARELWKDLGAAAPDTGFRANGSLTVAQRPDELAVLEQVCERGDAEDRGVRLLDPAEARQVNPAVRGDLLAAMHCSLDALVEPRAAQPALRRHLATAGEHCFVGGRTVVDVDTGVVLDHTGERHEGDLVIVCPGAEASGAVAELVRDAPLRKVQLQMMETEPLDESLTTSIADGDSLRYYPGFRVPALGALAPPDEIVERHHMQLLIAQRLHGGLTIGDTHAYDEPFDFAVDEGPYDHLRRRAESVLGRALPPTFRRWSGVYSQALDEAICWRDEVRPAVIVVTGPGGRGMTLSPAIAEQTLSTID
jgi:FAD dependent oxidoreductase TIGR03364